MPEGSLIGKVSSTIRVPSIPRNRQQRTRRALTRLQRRLFHLSLLLNLRQTAGRAADYRLPSPGRRAVHSAPVAGAEPGGRAGCLARCCRGREIGEAHISKPSFLLHHPHMMITIPTCPSSISTTTDLVRVLDRLKIGTAQGTAAVLHPHPVSLDRHTSSPHTMHKRADA